MRIFIASADSMFRLALQLLLESEPGMVVIGMSDRLEGLLTQVEVSQPEVLFLDYEIAQQATIGLISDLHHLEYQPKIVALSINPQVRETALAAGAYDFISKDVPPDDLLPILRKIRSTETPV
jgi:DNA-binding NarL/FixJ family response regulator